MIGFGAKNDGFKKEVATKRPENAFLQFDAVDRCIAFADANLHSLALGTTGSGKTRAFILPALRAHIEAGHSGLIVDIKGNFTDYVRSIAVNCGREKDVYELGLKEPAIPLNLLETMTVEGFYNFCISLINRTCDSKSHNMDFHAHGASMARDAFRMLKEIANWQREKFEEYTISPTLPLILELFNDPVEATKLFQLYERKVANKNDEETRKFIKQVRHSNFHIMNQDGTAKGSTHREQMSFATHGLIIAMKEFLDEEGMEAKFCGNCAPGIHCASLLEAGNKILVLRFGTVAGNAGATVARLILNDYYAAIYKLGLEKPEPRFVCIDEFQEVADLSSGKYSDANLVALGREFNCGFMGATQSLSALVAKSSKEAAEGFLSNCNQKIFLYSEDPLTRENAMRFDENIDLIRLKPEDVFAVTYNSETRQHRWGLESLSFSYKSCLDLEPLKGEPNQKEFPKISIERVINFIVNSEEKMERRKNPGIPDDVYEVIMKDGEAPDADDHGAPDYSENKSDDDPWERRGTYRARAKSCWESVKHLFIDGRAEIIVPWYLETFVCQTLKIFENLNPSDNIGLIRSIKMKKGRLVAFLDNAADPRGKALNNILQLHKFLPGGNDSAEKVS